MDSRSRSHSTSTSSRISAAAAQRWTLRVHLLRSRARSCAFHRENPARFSLGPAGSSPPPRTFQVIHLARLLKSRTRSPAFRTRSPLTDVRLPPPHDRRTDPRRDPRRLDRIPRAFRPRREALRGSWREHVDARWTVEASGHELVPPGARRDRRVVALDLAARPAKVEIAAGVRSAGQTPRRGGPAVTIVGDPDLHAPWGGSHFATQYAYASWKLPKDRLSKRSR